MAGDETSPSIDSRISTPAKLNVTELRILVVGKEPKRICVPVCLLTKSSTFLRSACKPEWKEQSGTIPLPEETTETVEAYVQWLYTGVLYVSTPQKVVASIDPGKNDREFVEKILVDSDAFGTFLGDASYCNTITDELMKYFVIVNKVCYPSIMAQAVERLRPSSTLFRFLRDQAVDLSDEAFPAEAEAWPKAFLLEVSKRLHAECSGSEEYLCPNERERCHYHDHDDEAPKCTGPKPWEEKKA